MKNNNIFKKENLGIILGTTAIIFTVFVAGNAIFGQNAGDADKYDSNKDWSNGNVSEVTQTYLSQNSQNEGDLTFVNENNKENNTKEYDDSIETTDSIDIRELSQKDDIDEDSISEPEKTKEEASELKEELNKSDKEAIDDNDKDNTVVSDTADLSSNDNSKDVVSSENKREAELNENDSFITELAEEDTRYKEIDEDPVDLSKCANGQLFTDNVYYAQDGQKVLGEQIIGDMKYNFASDGRLYKESGIKGIDVSVNQGENIDWNAVKNSGVKFVIIRVGLRGYTQGGLYPDKCGEKNINGATAAGLKVGLYFFSQAVNDAEAVEEANYCLNIARRYKISYPIYIDSEYSNDNHNGRADGLDRFTRTSVCKAFCETIKSAGYTPGVYASKFWFYNNLDYRQLNPYKIWLAHYCGVTDYKGKYDMWQHSSKGSVSGITGNVDMDYGYLGY